MAVITITKDNFKSEVLESDKTVLLDFWVEQGVIVVPCKESEEVLK